MLIEGLRVFYPKLYAVIRDNPALVLGEIIDISRDEKSKHEKVRERLKAAMEGLDTDAQEAAISLLRALFPMLNAVYGNMHYGPDWEQEWTKAQRVASREYFSRYFSYGILNGDVPDQTISGFIQAADTISPEEIARRFRELVQQRNAEKFVQKLRRQERAVSLSASRTLALALARSGDLFPNPKTFLDVLNPRPQVAISISNLIENLLTQEDRFELAELVLSVAEPLSFAAECFRWFSIFDEESRNPRAFSNEENEKLGSKLVERIEGAARRSLPLFVGSSEGAVGILRIWRTYGPPGATNEYVRSILDREPKYVLDFLTCYLSTVFSEAGVSRGAFERPQYDAVAETVEPAIINRALARHLGERYQVPESFIRHNPEMPSDITLALQFAWLYSHVSAQEQSAPAENRVLFEE